MGERKKMPKNEKLPYMYCTNKDLMFFRAPKAKYSHFIKLFFAAKDYRAELLLLTNTCAI